MLNVSVFGPNCKAQKLELTCKRETEYCHKLLVVIRAAYFVTNFLQDFCEVFGRCRNLEHKAGKCGVLLAMHCCLSGEIEFSQFPVDTSTYQGQTVTMDVGASLVPVKSLACQNPQSGPV